MKYIYVVIIICLFCVIAGVALDYDTVPEKTYCWMEECNDGIENGVVKYQLMSCIESRLKSMGYTVSEADKADYFLEITIRVEKNQPKVSSQPKYMEVINSRGSSVGSIWDFSAEQPRVESSVSQTRENVHVKMYDAKTFSVIWNSNAGLSYTDGMSDEKKADSLGETARLIFESFPIDALAKK